MFRLAHNYYNRSFMIPAALLFAVGCGGANQVARNAPTVPFDRFDSDRSSALLSQLQKPPYIVKFRAGQVIPVDFTLDSKLMKAQDEDFVVIAKRDFYVLDRRCSAPTASSSRSGRRTTFASASACGARNPRPSTSALGCGPRRSDQSELASQEAASSPESSASAAASSGASDGASAAASVGDAPSP